MCGNVIVKRTHTVTYRHTQTGSFRVCSGGLDETGGVFVCSLPRDGADSGRKWMVFGRCGVEVISLARCGEFGVMLCWSERLGDY